jgi:hypothetical protein
MGLPNPHRSDWWRGRDFVNESAVPRDVDDATRFRTNRLTDAYWPPYGRNTTKIKVGLGR